MYYVARLGPIEIGRVTILDGPTPYFVTVNAVYDKGFNNPLQPATNFIKSFSDFYEAKAYAVSFFPPNNQAAVEWIQYP
jgi:hypothetical protein